MPSVVYGAAGDIPVPADYTGDGKADFAVWRASSHTWFVQGMAAVSFGTSTDTPVPGDYTGEGTADIAVLRPSTGVWYVNGRWNLGIPVASKSGDIPTHGDYNGSGTTGAAVWRPSISTFYCGWEQPVRYGVAGDIPVPRFVASP